MGVESHTTTTAVATVDEEPESGRSLRWGRDDPQPAREPHVSMREQIFGKPAYTYTPPRDMGDGLIDASRSRRRTWAQAAFGHALADLMEMAGHRPATVTVTGPNFTYRISRDPDGALSIVNHDNEADALPAANAPPARCVVCEHTVATHYQGQCCIGGCPCHLATPPNEPGYWTDDPSK